MKILDENQDLKELLKMCFIEDPQERPTSKRIYEGSFFMGYVPFLQNAPLNKIVVTKKVEFSNNLHETGHFFAYINHAETISSMKNNGTCPNIL